MIKNSDPNAVNSARKVPFPLSTTGTLRDGQITSEDDGGGGLSTAE